MFVEYELTLEDEQRNAKQIVCFLYRRLLLASVILTVLAVLVFALDMTIFDMDKTLLVLCFSLLFIVVTILATFLAVYFLSVKNTKKAFAMYSKDGKEKFSIEYEEGIYTFCNASKGNVVKYSRSDIVSVTPYKSMLILKLISKQIVACPNDENTREMFAGYLSSKK